MTAVKTAEIRTRLLAESGRLLASSLDYEETLRTVARLAVPLFADFCSVDLVDEQHALDRVASAHDLGSSGTLADELERIAPASLPLDHPVRQVVETGVPLFHPDVSEEQLAAAARNEDHRQLLNQLELRSVLVVPMRVPTRTIGLMTLATRRSGRRMHREDVELAEQLARRAAVAVENSRLHTKLAGVAETLQKALLPAEVPSITQWEIEALYWPTETELRIDVGGDFYEVFDHDGRWFVILGDVAGKGVTAASVTALLRHGARVACRTEPSPAAILARLDESLAQQEGYEMATALCMCLHHDHVVISSAGHPPAIVVGTDGELREAPAADPLLGAFADAERREEDVPIAAGELLVLYTDGVIDAPGRNERFGPERLRLLPSGLALCSPSAALDRLGAELAAFSPRTGGDDIAVLVMRLAPEDN
jgi:serine phosphatase RsbU (regulator of sigma subunit)